MIFATPPVFQEEALAEEGIGPLPPSQIRGGDCFHERSEESLISHLVPSGPIWSIRITKSPAFAQVLAFREMPETSSQALNPCDGYRQHTCQMLLSSMVPNGFNMFQCVPVNYLPIKHGGFPIYINTGFMDFPWPSSMEVWRG